MMIDNNDHDDIDDAGDNENNVAIYYLAKRVFF